MSDSPELIRQLGGVLDGCARGELSPTVALVRLLLLEPEPSVLRRWLELKGEGEPASETLKDLLDRHEDGILRTAATLHLAGGDAAASAPARNGDGLAATARLFDQAVAQSPEAAVAAYSLGDPGLLAEATAEVAALLDRLGLLSHAHHLLDVGCGIGRMEEALASRVGAITGIDLSREMVREARERCAGLANVMLLETSGRDLSPFPDAVFDAAIAVDTLPYLYQAGGTALVRSQLAEIARVLRPKAELLVLNLSYRGDLAEDRADAALFVDELGLTLLRNGTADLRLWDGRSFHFRNG